MFSVPACGPQCPQCGYREYWPHYKAITYETLLTSERGWLNAGTGKFTAPAPGVYKVDFTSQAWLGFQADLDSGKQSVQVELFRNGRSLGGHGLGQVTREDDSKTLIKSRLTNFTVRLLLLTPHPLLQVLSLAPGDTIWAQNMPNYGYSSGSLHRAIFCVTFTAPATSADLAPHTDAVEAFEKGDIKESKEEEMILI